MIVTNFRATRDEYIFQGKKILGKKSLFKQIQKFAIYIAVMFALWKPLVIFYLVEFLFALLLCLRVFKRNLAFYCSLSTRNLTPGRNVNNNAYKNDRHSFSSSCKSYERRLNSNVINRVCHSAGLSDKFDSCRVG